MQKILIKSEYLKQLQIAAEKSIINNKGKKELFLLDDGIFLAPNYKKINIVKGDSNYVSIAAASISSKIH